ncbi:hypothetical protein GYW21_09315 [Lactobacillus mellis]|nr:hypothetical protein [Bombilactobacillus mellis]
MNQQKWQDKKGQVFFIFTNQKAGNYLGWSKSKVVKAKKELMNYALLSNKKTMSADHLYLYLPKIRKQDYYVPNEFSAQYHNGSFIPKKLRGFFIPTALFDNPKYKNLSSNAKLLYGIYTKRQQLSQMNQQKWQDKEGQVFFVFKNQEAGNYLGWGNGKIVRVKKELINYGLLINKKTMSEDHLYLHLPENRKQDCYEPKDSACYTENNPTIKSQQQVKVPNKFPAKHQNSQFIPKELRGFFIPTTLFDNPKYKNLSSNAKLLYGIYTMRQQLSQMNQQKWQDKEGQVFFVFKNQEAGNYLGWGNGKVVRVKKELINYGLLVNKKTMSEDHLYLLVPKIRKQDYHEPKDSARYSENNQSVKSQQQVKVPNKSFAKYMNSKFSSNEHLNLVNKETKYINTNKDTNKSDTYIQTKIKLQHKSSPKP